MRRKPTRTTNPEDHSGLPARMAVAALWSLAAVPTVLAAGAAALPPPSGDPGLTYEKDVKPLFERSCTKCHGEEKQKARLRLDSREAALEGADGRAVILPGKSAESRLILVAAHVTEEEDEWMPPAGKAPELSAEEIGLLRAWIDQGAK